MMKTIMLTLCAVAVVISQPAGADEQQRNQAKRIHDRLTGVNATNKVLDDMESLLDADPSGKSAARYAIDRVRNPNARYFYNVTLKNFAAPWTNEEQSVFTPLNDYSATVVGAIRDAIDFRRILYDDLIYVGKVGGISPYRNDNNNHCRNSDQVHKQPTHHSSNA